MVMLILLVWRIGFGVTGMELVGVMPTVQGFVRCDAGSLWLVIIPKTVITDVLTVMSGMDAHMIRWNLRWVWFGLV
jgi:hypothetical protein